MVINARASGETLRKQRLHAVPFPLAAALSIARVCVPLSAMTISKGGVPQAAIVLAPGANIQERHAAVELAGFLEQVAGGKFHIIEQPRDNAANLCVH